MNEKLLFADDLAREMNRSRSYIYAMKAQGFQMPGGQATLSDARDWLTAHPEFSTTKYVRKKSKAKGGRRKSIYLNEVPAGTIEQQIYFRDGEEVLKNHGLAIPDQILIDQQTGQGNGFEDEFLGKFFREKVESMDVSYFQTLAVMLQRRKEKSPPLDPVRYEMVLIKMKANKDGIELSWDEVSDQLRHCSADKKTIEKAAGEIGLRLRKRARGRPSQK